MQSATNKEKADLLLIEWHQWSRAYRPALGAPGCSPACRNSKTSRQWDSESTITDDDCHALEMRAVDECYNALDMHCRQAIGCEMRNRTLGAKVWMAPTEKTYDQALDAILPLMRRNGLLD